MYTQQKEHCLLRTVPISILEKLATIGCLPPLGGNYGVGCE